MIGVKRPRIENNTTNIVNKKAKLNNGSYYVKIYTNVIKINNIPIEVINIS
jgi:hypothetical protein